MSKENPQQSTTFWIFFAFIVWIFSFWGFLSSKLVLTSDALSYYEHTKFFVENLSHGIYPLWDPFWVNGAPNDFFLRRIGALNPFYLIIILFKSVGIPYTLSYLWFLALYYWSGMVAFYLLAMRIYHDRFIAYAGYLILLFSALGTRLFDSYMMLVTVPLIWFFYFLVAFSQTPRKHFFLGLVLFFMILAGTYIPFYFLIILGLFLVLFFLTFPDQIPKLWGRYTDFFRKNKILTVLSLLILSFSFLPLITFFHDSSQGQMILPARHGDAGLGHTLIVPRQTLDWGAVEDLFYSSFFSNLRQYKFAVVYVPFFSFIVLFLGLIGRITRRAVFIFLLGMVLFCSIVPHGLPFYDFFYKHIFILKYFRNLHFFIWFFLIPLFVLLVLEHWKIFTEIKITNSRQQLSLFLYVVGVHLLAFLFVWQRKDAVSSTYVMIALSLVLWSLIVLRRRKANIGRFALLTLLVLVQPLEAYHYLSLNAAPYFSSAYVYNFSFSTLQLKDSNLLTPENTSRAKDTLYYASGGYNFIYQNIDNYPLARYLQNKFILVDHLEAVEPNQINTTVLEYNFLTNNNSAIVFAKAGEGVKLNSNDPYPPAQAMPIDENSTFFKLLAFDANHARIAMDIPYQKFLIYNDSYNSNWRVNINHHQATLYETNGAFKGVWIPAGHSIIEFDYGSWWQYLMNILLSILAFIFLAGLIWYACLSVRYED